MQTPKNKIAKLDYILTGTIIKKHGPCGKAGCRCTHDKRYWHGPYYIWTRKENGKTITKSLSTDQAQFCKKAIINMAQLKKELENWKQHSAKELEKL